MGFPRILVLAGWMTIAAAAKAQTAPPLDAPELAHPGQFAVGVTEKQLVQQGQLDPIQSIAAQHIVTHDRPLRLIVWYPAKPGGHATHYHFSLTAEPPLPPKSVDLPGAAVADAAAVGDLHPVVILSHGLANDPAMTSWIGENLASKGFVAVAITHHDPAYTERDKLISPIMLRPLDIAFVTHAIAAGFLGRIADPAKIALIGYSLGGYGVLTAAGATLDPDSVAFTSLPPYLKDYFRKICDEQALAPQSLKAVIAIAPAGGAPFSPWGRNGLASVVAPLLVIAGDSDRTVGFDPGPAAIFAAAVGSPRRMLVFKGAGHAIGTGPVPDAMRDSVWNQDWFADPVWRKERLNAISLHFITAFLDLNLLGDALSAAYFQVSDPDSDKSPWTGPDTPYAAVSDGGANKAWKGFVRNHQVGLILRQLAPQP